VRGLAIVSMLAALSFTPACGNGCDDADSQIDISWRPSPVSEAITVEVDVGALVLTANCPSMGDQSIPMAGSYSCNSDSLLLLIPNLDLSSTKTVSVTVTTTATGEVRGQNQALPLGPASMTDPDGAPGHCDRAAIVTLM
jgi:hypothetical protein